MVLHINHNLESRNVSGIKFLHDNVLDMVGRTLFTLAQIADCKHKENRPIPVFIRGNSLCRSYRFFTNSRLYIAETNILYRDNKKPIPHFLMESDVI